MNDCLDTLMSGILFYTSSLCGCLFLQFFKGKVQFSGRYKLLEFIYVPIFSTFGVFGAIDYFKDLKDKTMLCCAGVWATSMILIIIIENWNNLSIIGLLVKISVMAKMIKMLYKGEIDKMADLHKELYEKEAAQINNNK